MADYAIDDGHGNQITAGIEDYTEALATATRMATDRGEPVYLHEMGDEDSEDSKPERIAPEVEARDAVLTAGDICTIHASCDGSEDDCRDSSGGTPGTGRGVASRMHEVIVATFRVARRLIDDVVAAVAAIEVGDGELAVRTAEDRTWVVLRSPAAPKGNVVNLYRADVWTALETAGIEVRS